MNMDLLSGSIEEAIQKMERDMKAMWDTGSVLHYLRDDKEFIRMIMSALFYERIRFQSEIDVIIGEA
tara:strand:+ start:1211 stop:1411 length:201 start_codon:yes stop_codon:yes gene_type:complete